MDPAISSAIPEGCCVFCDSPSQAVERYGKFLHHEESGIRAHYYCMLFACGLSQRGETNEGIEGFLIKDILAERKRAQKLKCKYCKKKGASVGCSVKACHQIYHYGCGLDEGAIYLFYDSFVSYCVKHRPVQKVLPSSCSPSKGTCPICMDNVETTPGNSVLKTPCCKGTWLHRDCVQMQALSAGYFFRCAICNNENEFQDEMKKFGIYLPEKDADWEFGGNAYQELYERHNRCDVDKCRCPRGRKYATQSGQWEVVLCDLCGSAGCHLSCGGLVTALDDWACRDCTSTFTRGFMEQSSSANGGSKEKYVPPPGSQPTRTPVPGGTRARSAIRSQGKRPRPPPTTPRPLKKTKHSSTPLCPPLSPVSNQQSSLSSSPKSTPCQTMKFPQVSLSPTYEREFSGPGSSRRSGDGKFGELLPKLDCYVAMEPTSHKVYGPNLSMPSLSPAASSAKKHKSGKKLKCKKARKLDLNSCELINETNTTHIYSSRRQGNAIQTGNSNLSAPDVICSQIGEGKEPTIKPSWGSRLLESVGSLIWRKSPSKLKAPESSEGNQERKATYNNNDDIQKSSLSQKQHSDVSNSSSSSLDSGEYSTPNSNSPIALSEEMKAQIIPVTSDKIPTKTKNLLHDLTSWKDDATWKEAKQDLAHLFQVDGRATRSALKKDVETPVKTTGKERKSTMINKDDIPQTPTEQNKPVSNFQINLSNSSDNTYAHQVANSPIALSEEVRAQIIPVTSDNIPTKTKNMLHDLTSWKDDTTWKEAKQDLAHLFQLDGRATRSTLKKDEVQMASSTALCSPVKKKRKLECSSSQNTSSPAQLSEPTPQKDDAIWKIPKGDLANVSQGSDRMPRSGMRDDGQPESSTLTKEDDTTFEIHGISILNQKHDAITSPASKVQNTETYTPETGGGHSFPQESASNLRSRGKNMSLDLRKLTAWKGGETWKEFREDMAVLLQTDGRTTRNKAKKDGLKLSYSSDDTYAHQVANSPIPLSEEVRAQIIPVTSDNIPTKTKNRLHDLTSWKDDTTWKEAKQDLAHLFQLDGRATRSTLKKDEVQMASSTALCSPVKKKRKLECSPSQSTSSPAQLSEPTPQKDDAIWKKPKGDLANFSQGSDRMPRSGMRDDGQPESSTLTKEDDTTFEIHGISILNQNHDAITSPASIVQNTEMYTHETDGGHSFPQESASNLRSRVKNMSLDLRKLTAWKGGETWKEFREDMAVLLQTDGRTTRNKAKKDGLKGIYGSPKVDGKETLCSSMKKGQILSSMPVLEKVVPADEEICSPTHKVHRENYVKEPEKVLKADVDIGVLSSNEIRLCTTSDASPYSVCDIRKESAIENKKSRKRLSKVFHRGHNDEVNKKDNTVSKKNYCAENFEVSSSKLDLTFDKTTKTLQEVMKPMMLDHSSQTATSIEEVDVYISSMGLWYKEPNYLPPPFKTHGNHRTGYTQTYNSKYEKHHTESTPTMDQSASNEENGFNGETEDMTANICKSLVDETLGNAMKQSKCSVKETQQELWKEAKEDLQTLLTAEERITRSCRKKSKESEMIKGPSVAKEKPELSSSTPIAKPSPSLDLRKRKYCCSHMRSPWKSSPAKNESSCDGISTEPEDLLHYSPMFKKQPHHNTDYEDACAFSMKDFKTLNSLSVGQCETLASVRKIWKPKVHSSVKCDQKKERTNTSWYSSKKLGVPRLQNDETKKEEANTQFQKCTPKKIGRPRKQSHENSVTAGEPQDDKSEMKEKLGRPRKYPDDVIQKEKSKSPPNLEVCTSKKKKLKRAQKHPDDVTQHEKSKGPPNRVLSPLEKKKTGRTRKLLDDVTVQGKSRSPPKQEVVTSEKKKLGRPQKHLDDVNQQEKNKNAPQKEFCSSDNKTIGRPKKLSIKFVPSLTTQQEKVGSLSKQMECTSGKKKLGRPQKHPFDVTLQKKSKSLPQQEVRTSENKTVGRLVKYPDDVTHQEKSERPTNQVLSTSEKKRIGRPRKYPDDVTQQEKSESPPNQVLYTSEKKRIGRPRKYPDDVTQQEKSESPPNQVLSTTDKKRIGRSRQHSVNIPVQKSDCGNTSKQPKNGKVSDMQQPCQGTVEDFRSTGEARSLESSTIHPTNIKAFIDNEVETIFMDPREDLQAGQTETCNSSTQTDAPVEEVEAYVASRGKHYLEPCFMMPRPNLNRMETFSDMRTQTYNLQLSQCLEDEIKRSCPPLVYNEINRPPSTRKKKKNKCKKTPPSLTPEKVCSAYISPSISAASSPVTTSIPCTSRTDSSSQTEAPVEHVEAFIQSMGELYREPSIIVTRLQETTGDEKHSVRTQTYNLNLPDRELPMFKKKWSKRVQTQIKSTQTAATWDEVHAYIDKNKQLYTDPNYSTIQSYSVIGSSLTRHIPTQTYSFNLDEETSEVFSEIKGIPDLDQTPSTENDHEFCIEPQVKAVNNGTEEIGRPSHQQEKSDQNLKKPLKTNCDVTGTGLHVKKQNWFRLKPKK